MTNIGQRQGLGLNAWARAISALPLASTAVGGAALKPNAVILHLGLHTTGRFNPIL